MSVPHLELKATMARVRSCWGHTHTVALIWLISATTFVSVFQMALRNSSSTYPFSDNPVLNKERRSRLYDRMTKDLEEHGAAFLKLGETSQSLSISELFTLKDGYVTPNHKAAIPPVRANVLYLNPEYSNPISVASRRDEEYISPDINRFTRLVTEKVAYIACNKSFNGSRFAVCLTFPTSPHLAVRSTFLPHFDPKIWFQNSSLYHFSMFHASHHIAPVPATEEEIEAEATAVKAVAESLCPLKIALDRVVLTSTGVLLGCWQVISGTDPITIRAKLKSVLPRAPEKQLYDVAILHTSLARLLGHPSTSPGDVDKILDLQFFNGLVRELNDKIRGFQATVTELWYVEEFDVLALAVDGNMKVRKFQLGCSKA